jgi:hypothetical protein
MPFANTVPLDTAVLTPATDPQSWHDFASSFAGASAALLGLAFLAISFNLDAILQHRELPGRAVETLAFFAFPLFGSLLLQVPGLSNVGLGTGQAVLTIGMAVLVASDVPRWKRERNDPVSWRVTHLAPALIIAVLSGIGTVATFASGFGGLYWLAASMVTATAAGIINSWVLLVEIKR